MPVVANGQAVKGHSLPCSVSVAGGYSGPRLGPASPLERVTAVLTFTNAFFPLLGSSSLRVKNCGFSEAFLAWERCFCIRSAYAVYFIKSGNSLRGEHLWLDGSSRDCWEWLGQSRNKHTMNITTWLSWQIPSWMLFEIHFCTCKLRPTNGRNRKYKEGNKNHPLYHHRELTVVINITLNFLLFASKCWMCT